MSETEIIAMIDDWITVFDDEERNMRSNRKYYKANMARASYCCLLNLKQKILAGKQGE